MKPASLAPISQGLPSPRAAHSTTAALAFAGSDAPAAPAFAPPPRALDPHLPHNPIEAMRLDPPERLQCGAIECDPDRRSHKRERPLESRLTRAQLPDPGPPVSPLATPRRRQRIAAQRIGDEHLIPPQFCCRQQQLKPIVRSIAAERRTSPRRTQPLRRFAHDQHACLQLSVGCSQDMRIRHLLATTATRDLAHQRLKGDGVDKCLKRSSTTNRHPASLQHLR